ncbi:MAG: diguanylate cyclase [Epsilonproteobacteria bacterium]|nr:diguanylate cyclase [Campylobacterota bacterium]
MKYSIAKIFKNITNHFTLLFIFLTLIVALFADFKISDKKIEILTVQIETAQKLNSISKENLNLAMIQFTGERTKFKNDIERLKELYKLDLLGEYYLNNKFEYMNDLQELETRLTAYSDELESYLKSDINETKSTLLTNSYETLYTSLKDIMYKDIFYNQRKSDLLFSIAVVTLILSLSVLVWYRRRLKMIYEDILFLYAIERDKNGYTIATEEMDAIAIRMKRKPVATENPANIDPLTQINNHKGLVSSYAEKKGMKDSNFVSVTVLEIDNITKTNRLFSQEATQAILKKIAYTISLHEQPTDVIARTDYNQFTIIFSRPTKELAYKDIEHIRQSIAEIRVKSELKGIIQITVSGGFIIKAANKHLDEAIRQAKEVLQHAKSMGGNRVSQQRDLAESHF